MLPTMACMTERTGQGDRMVTEPGGGTPALPVGLETIRSLAAHLRALGVEPGMTLMVHSSLSSLGFVVGGAAAVILALEHVLGDTGTLAMPAHVYDLTDPAAWLDPIVPEAWHEAVRAAMPVFQPDLMPCREMGAIAETFRKQDGTLRSYHPFVSWSARGPHAARITANHHLSMSQGEGSPLARLYDLGAHVLLLGVGWNRNTTFHLAEYRCRFAETKRCTRGAPMPAEGGGAVWTTYDDIYWYDADFPELGVALEGADLVRCGTVGKAHCRLFSQRAAVDFAVDWMNRHRTLGAG